MNPSDRILIVVCLTIGFALGLLLGGGGTYLFTSAELESVKADFAGWKARQADEKTQAASVALERLQRANERADVLQSALDKTEQKLSTTQKEMQREIKLNTTGRACLNARTVRLLNDDTHDNQPASLPTTTGQPAEEDAAAATDTDVADWIAIAKTQYATCTARLDALIDWQPPKDAAPND